MSTQGVPEGNPENKRRHRRMVIDQPARARKGQDGGNIDIQLRDVSAGGAAFDVDDDEDLFDEEILELEIDDVGVMSAEFSRTADDGVAVRFVDIDDQEEEMLLADLERFGGSIKMDDL